MNVNDLRTKLDNAQIQLETPKQMIAFTNSDIIVIDEYGYRWIIEKIEYSSEMGAVFMSLVSAEGGETV